MAEPRIYAKNYVNDDDAFTVSHGASAIANAYDRDKESQWVSSGAAADATEASIQVDFKEGSVLVSRTIDTLILVNHNVKNGVVEYWDGAAWQTWQTLSNLSASTSVVTLSSQVTAKARLRMTVTQTTNVEKRIGELVFTAIQLDVGQDFSGYKVNWRENAVTIKKGDGSLQRQIKRFTPNRYEKYQAEAQFDLLPLATLEALLTIRKAGQPFLWQPESTQRPDELYYVDWVGDMSYSYTGMFKNSGFRVGFTVAEV